MKLPKKLDWQRCLDFAQASLLGATQRELGDQFGVTERTVRNWISSEWFEQASREIERGGLNPLIAKARVRLEQLVESEDERVALTAVRFALERLDNEFAPASSRAAESGKSSGGNLADVSDAALAKMREQLDAVAGKRAAKAEEAPHEHFAFDFAQAQGGEG